MKSLGLDKLLDVRGKSESKIAQTLAKLTQEVGCEPKDIFVTITAVDDSFKPSFYVFQKIAGKPTPVRPITLEEILSDDESDEDE
jgi:hypothetical protein